MHYSLNNEELKLVKNAEVLVMKNSIIKKVCEMFGALSERYTSRVHSSFDDIYNNVKISRGENYEGLPYVMLDYPRQFSKTDIFAVRTFFWWGNFFSITLLLQGVYQKKFESKIDKAIQDGLLDDWFITSSNNAWQHHFNDDYCQPVKNRKDYKLSELPFIKVATKIPLTEWDEAENFLTENFLLLINILNG